MAAYSRAFSSILRRARSNSAFSSSVPTGDRRRRRRPSSAGASVPGSRLSLSLRLAFTPGKASLDLEGRARPAVEEGTVGPADAVGLDIREVSCEVKSSELETAISRFCFFFFGRWP